jgi:hypothetical protein
MANSGFGGLGADSREGLVGVEVVILANGLADLVYMQWAVPLEKQEFPYLKVFGVEVDLEMGSFPERC